MNQAIADGAALEKCPFCLIEKVAEAPVCPTCNRDTLPPPALVEERDELLRHRDALRAQIAEKTQRLAT